MRDADFSINAYRSRKGKKKKIVSFSVSGKLYPNIQVVTHVITVWPFAAQGGTFSNFGLVLKGCDYDGAVIKAVNLVDKILPQFLPAF